MNVGRWRLGRFQPGPVHPLCDRNATPGQGTQVEGILGGLRDGHVTKAGGDSKHLDGRMGECEIQGHGVVHAGVGIENNPMY